MTGCSILCTLRRRGITAKLWSIPASRIICTAPLAIPASWLHARRVSLCGSPDGSLGYGGQRHDKRSAFARAGVGGFHRPAVHLDDGFADRQAEAETFAPRADLFERIEDLARLNLGRAMFAAIHLFDFTN